MALATCKYQACNGDVLHEAVVKVSAIPKAPHYVAVVAACSVCGRQGQYVVERDEYERVQAESMSREEQVMAAARIEVEAVESADDLIVLWRSLPAPLMEVRQHCKCAVCERRRSG